MSIAPVIVWFRQDLRLADNPALTEAAKTGAPVLPVYILDDKNADLWKMGSASRWWLHYSLHALNANLSGSLACFNGDASKILPTLVKSNNVKAIYWNRCYEPWRIARDTGIKKILEELGIEARAFNAGLLIEPWSVKKSDGSPYRVFTPFFRKGLLGQGDPLPPLPAPKAKSFFCPPSKSLSIDQLNLLPKIQWGKKMEAYWTIGEKGAQARLKDFLDNGLQGYKEGRNYPDRNNVSRLSPHIHFGEISPRTVWHAVRQRMLAERLETDGDCYLSELGWREFSYNLLYCNPDLPEKPLQRKFENLPWDKDPKALHAWKMGQTGYPIVDAGMRELWETGWMHNRVRMIAASFLIKDLMLPWQEGEKWFWDCLVDADLANNAASWQWVAGCGADAAPYFRIFNPVTQGEKFDPAGNYIRRFIPELAKLPDKYIHRPWEAPENTLSTAGVILGKTYPKPIIDHAAARERALESFKSLR